MTTPKKLVVFDAYGTLFDVYSIARAAESMYPNFGMALASLWRDKQIDYTRIVSLSDPNATQGSRYYESFWIITKKALRFSAEKLKLELSDEQEDTLMQAYDRLEAFAENQQVLESLRAMGLQTAILSNANLDMLERVSKHAQIHHLFDKIISVEQVRQFKTHPSTYALVEESFPVERSSILFVSSNDWDALGATWFGWETVWLNRSGQARDRLGPAIAHTALDLKSVLHLLQCA
jgi:2-haloacid dehalogenase